MDCKFVCIWYRVLFCCTDIFYDDAIVELIKINFETAWNDLD